MRRTSTLADEELVRKYAKGDNNAFDILLMRYKDKLYSYIYFIVHNEDLANDLFQETFVKAIMTIQQGRYTESGRFSAWITRIAHNLIIDQFRQEKNENLVSNDESEGLLLNNAQFSDTTIEMKMITDQSLVDVQHLMNELPDNQREVVYMRFYQGLDFKEIAEITGVSINTALGRMRYAILNMRRMVQQRNISLTVY